MRSFLWVPAVLAILAGLLAAPGETSQTLIVGAGSEGYLSPCGCFKPMTGGLKRRATAVRQIRKSQPKAAYLEMGPFSGGMDRQQEIKAETTAQILDELQPAAIGLAAADAKLGLGMLESLQRLSGDRIIASGLSNGWRQFAESGPVLTASIDPDLEAEAANLQASYQPESAVMSRLFQEAGAAGLTPAVLYQGDLPAAKAFARRHPKTALILYRHHGNPPQGLEWEGTTALATAGEKGKHILNLTFLNGRVTSMRVITLGPEYADDADASRIFNGYLERIGEEKLLEKIPRTKSPDFVGSRACQPCHADAWDAWKNSKHAGALSTLEKQGHDRDPDCVSCHVVGLEFEKGFQSRNLTPDLADVGCESCHGAGAAHAKDPYGKKMGEAGEKSCMTCHVPDHSPGFSFEEYWEKIKH